MEDSDTDINNGQRQSDYQMSDAGSQAGNQTYEVDTGLTDVTSRYTANCSNSSHSNGSSNCTDASHLAGQPSTENGNQAFQFWLTERLVLVSAAVSAKCKQRLIAGQTSSLNYNSAANSWVTHRTAGTTAPTRRL